MVEDIFVGSAFAEAWMDSKKWEMLARRQEAEAQHYYAELTKQAKAPTKLVATAVGTYGRMFTRRLHGRNRYETRSGYSNECEGWGKRLGRNTTVLREGTMVEEVLVRFALEHAESMARHTKWEQLARAQEAEAAHYYAELAKEAKKLAA